MSTRIRHPAVSWVMLIQCSCAHLISLMSALKYAHIVQINTVSYYYVGFEVFPAVVVKSTVLWDITPCSPLSVNRRFGGTYHLYLQGRKNNFNKKPAWKHFFYPEGEGDMYLRTVIWHSTDYTALYPRRLYVLFILLLVTRTIVFFVNRHIFVFRCYSSWFHNKTENFKENA
jgi:hypothetical protein